MRTERKFVSIAAPWKPDWNKAQSRVSRGGFDTGWLTTNYKYEHWLSVRIFADRLPDAKEART